MVKAKRVLLVVFVVFIIISSAACIGRGKKEAATSKNYVTPCNVVGEKVLIKAEGDKLGAGIIKRPLAEAFVDDLLSVQAQDAWSSYTLECWWAKNIGETRGLYYCGGSYIVPDLDERGVITRYIRKNLKIGFEVESRKGVSFVIQGRTHKEPAYYLLTVKEIKASCVVA